MIRIAMAVFISGAMLLCCPVFAAAKQNLALGAAYTVSPQQSYPLSAPPSDKKALTDGVRAVGRFWTQKSTLGWQRERTVEILIDLGKSALIGTITLETARGEKADVYFPERISAFVGPDQDHFVYVGNLSDSPENLAGSYAVRQFELAAEGVIGRYVLLLVKPNGPYFFCDEIEVFAGDSSGFGAGTAYTLEEARGLNEQLYRLDIDKKILLNRAASIEDLLDGNSQPSVGKLRGIEERIRNADTSQSLAEAESLLLVFRQQNLLNGSRRKILVQRASTWGSNDLISEGTDSEVEAMSLLAPRNGYDAKAFLLTNASKTRQRIEMDFDTVPRGGQLDLYQVPLVATSAFEAVADPLVPISTPYDLRPGESLMFWVAWRGEQPGKWTSKLKVSSADSSTELKLTLEVAEVVIPEHLSINSINWGYLDFKLIRDRTAAAADDLWKHHTNVVVVPPGYLPEIASGRPFDFTRMTSYLQTHKGVDKVLLFTNLRTRRSASGEDRLRLMDDAWKSAAAQWYADLLSATEACGLKPSQVYWYPYDEMRGPEVGRFVDLALWAKVAIPGVQFYATLRHDDSAQALPYLDIAQIHLDSSLIDKALPPHTERWLYGTKSPAKSQSPYAYYRLMSWLTYLKGFKGAGFWAYADAGWGDSPGSAWDDFDGRYPDYAVIYQGLGEAVLSSRRWEAWRMGLEDFELLSMYARSHGALSASMLARQILENPLDTERADKARQEMILALSAHADKPGATSN